MGYYSSLDSSRWRLWRGFALVLGGLVALDLLSFAIAEGSWFANVGFLPVFLTRLQTQLGWAVVTAAVSLALLVFNLKLALQRRWEKFPDLKKVFLPGRMRFRGLLLLTLTLSLLLTAIVGYYGLTAVSHWQPQQLLYGSGLPVPDRFRLELLGEWLPTWALQPMYPVLLLGVAIAVLVVPGAMSAAIALVVSLGVSLVVSQHWSEILLSAHATRVGQSEPLFGRDIGFYLFRLPVWELVAYWVVGLTAVALLTTLLIYLLSANSLSQGEFPGFSHDQLQHVYGLGGWALLATAFSFVMDCFDLLYSRIGANYGASYTDVYVRLPINVGLAVLAVAIAVMLFWQAITLSPDLYLAPALPHPIEDWRTGATAAVPHRRFDRGYRLSVGVLLLYVTAGIFTRYAVPLMVQRLIVQPNELLLEIPYIERTIAFTRAAFELDEIEVESFNPSGNLTFDTLQQNELTVKNIRLWDSRPLLETNRQLQRIRPYYEFLDADVDRYAISTGSGQAQQQQVLISARELDYNSVPDDAKTWVNEHFIYTHGYGFTVSPVNVAGESGLPDYFVRGIEHTVSSDRIRESIPIGKPRIYFGELTNTYVMTQTAVQELDYPSGSENVYTAYEGDGGVSIGALWQRLIFAKHLRDWRMIFAEDFTPQSKLLYRRNILNRVRAIAPFLQYDQDPYIVAAKVDGATDNVLYWIIDAYTVSDRFPYSDPINNPFNYIRNSVKVVVDAYHGSVSFYVVDELDPVISSWQKVFPVLFQSIEAMPPALLAHIRYPQDLFQAQSDHLMTYHMTDPQVFYNREDQWRAPLEVYADESQEVEPYYLIMRLPAEQSEEFILLRPYTPNQRTNLIAWLAARSKRIYQTGARENRYSKMLLYRFPKQDLVYGPEQLEARINQDPQISQQISLWNRAGSRATQGNLLIIPIETALLYVEPLYLEATLNRLPTLVRVITAYGDRIAMAETLDESLRALFLQPAASSDPIIRTLPEDVPLLEGEGP